MVLAAPAGSALAENRRRAAGDGGTESSATASTTFIAVSAFDAERVEAGEQAFEREPDAGGAFGAVDGLDFAALAVARDGAAQPDRPA